MHTDVLALAELSAKTGQAERLTWGVIELQVTDLNRAVNFWTTVLGLQDRNQSGIGVDLGTQEKTLVILRSGARQPVGPNCLGMYHVALGMPTQAVFSRILARLIALQIPVSPVDHLGSKAIYLKDPDGLEIEIAFETPERFGRFGDMTGGITLYDADGNTHSGRERLDIRAELSYAEGADLEAPLPDGTFVAHMHFKVDDLETAATWFEGIGFARNLMLQNFGLADMGTGAAYTHRLAMNVWAGPNCKPAPSDMARLTHYTLQSKDPAVLANAKKLQRTKIGLSGRDPSGTDMSLVLET